MPEPISTKLGVEIRLCSSVHPWNFRRPSSKYMAKLCLRKFVKFPKKVQKNGNPKKSALLATRGVHGCLPVWNTHPVCAHFFRADITDSPLFSPGSPLWLEGFQPTVYVCTLKNINIVCFFRCCNPESFGCLPCKFVCSPVLFSCFPHMQSGKFGVFSGHICGLSGLTLCFFWFLCLFCWKNFISIKRDGHVALSHWQKFFKMKCKKLNHLLTLDPWPIY